MLIDSFISLSLILSIEPLELNNFILEPLRQPKTLLHPKHLLHQLLILLHQLLICLLQVAMLDSQLLYLALLLINHIEPSLD